MTFRSYFLALILVSLAITTTESSNTTEETATQDVPVGNSGTTPTPGGGNINENTPPGGQIRNNNRPPGPRGGTNGKNGTKDEEEGGGGGSLQAGLIVLLLVGIAILVGLITCFVCYVRKGKLLRNKAREDARRMYARGDLRTDGSALYVNVNGDSGGTPSFFTTSQTNTDRNNAAPDNRRKIYKATVGDEASAAVVCEARVPPGPNERSVDVELGAQNRYTRYGGDLDLNSNKQTPEHVYASISKRSKDKKVDETNPDTDPANHVYSEIEESERNGEKRAKQSPTKSTHSNTSNGSTAPQYENIDEKGKQKNRNSESDSEGNYDVIEENDDVIKKNTSHLAPPSESDDEHSVIEQFDEVIEKFEEECNEKLTPTKVPRNLRVRRDSWVQEEGDEVDLAALRNQHSDRSDSSKKPPVKSGSLTDVRKTPQSDRKKISESTKDSPSKSSVTSGDSARSGGSSQRSDKPERPKRKDIAKQMDDSDTKSDLDTERLDNDGDLTDRDKLHDVTCLSLPPLPVGSQKSQTQTDSFSAAPPNAEQVRRDSLLGSLPPLEPFAFASEVTADIDSVLAETPLGRQSSKRKKKNDVPSSPKHKLDKRKYSVDNIDTKPEKHKDKSQRARLMKSGSLDDPSVGRESKDLPPDLLFKRSGSLKGKARRESKDHGSDEHRKHKADRERSKDSPKGSPTKKNSYKFKEIKRQDDVDFNSTAESDNLDSSMRQKAGQLVKNAIDSAKKEQRAETKKKTEEKTEETKNTFKDLYNMVNWGAGVEDTLREKHSARSGRKGRRHSVDDLDSDDDGERSPRSGSRERLTPRSREKRRSKRDTGHVSDDELLSARSKKKHGHGLDNLGYLDNNDTHHKKRRHHHRKGPDKDRTGDERHHHKQKHHRKHRGHRREGETEEEYQERKRRHLERKRQRKHQGQHHHKKRHHRDKNNADDEKDVDTKVNNADDKLKNGDTMNSTGMNNTMYGSDDSFSDSDSEMSGTDEKGLNNSMNKARKDSWIGAPNTQKGSGKKPNGFQIEDMELDRSFEV